jgi:DNA-binding transcriptional regulator YiaG
MRKFPPLFSNHRLVNSVSKNSVCALAHNHLVKPSSTHKPLVMNRLWRYRKQRRFSQRYVAHQLGHRSITQVSRWESGAKIPSLVNALLLAMILNAPVDALFADLTTELNFQLNARNEADLVAGEMAHRGEQKK